MTFKRGPAGRRRIGGGEGRPSGQARRVGKRAWTKDRAMEEFCILQQAFRTVIGHSNDGFVLADEEGTIVEWNFAQEMMTGVPKDSAIGRKVWDVQLAMFPSELTIAQKDEHRRRILAYFQIGDVPQGSRSKEMDIRRPDGTLRTIISSVFVIPAGKGFRMCSISRDITEHKRSGEALIESEEKFRNLAEQSPNMIFINVKGRVVYANRRCEELMGYTREEFHSPGFDYVTITAPEFRTSVKERFALHMSGQDLPPYEYAVFTKDGRRLDTILSTKLINYGGEKAILGTITDITERKRSEEELTRLSVAVRLSTDAIAITDLQWRLLDVNGAALRIFGAVAKAELQGRSWMELVAPEDQRKVGNAASEALGKGMVAMQQFEVVRSDGGRVTLETSVSTIRDLEGRPAGFVTISRDITERKRTEREMRRRLMNFRLEEGTVYLSKENGPSRSLGAFLDLIKAGYPGLYISRAPRKRSEAGRDGFEFLWVSERAAEDSIPPELDRIERDIDGRQRGTAILLDCLEYLVHRSGFSAFFRFVQHLREIAYIRGHIILLSIDPSTTGKGRLGLLERETSEIELVQRGALPVDLMEALGLVNERWLSGIRPSYTEVAQGLGLSHPTVRKRLRALLRMGYLTENINGRLKVVEPTEKARRLFVR